MFYDYIYILPGIFLFLVISLFFIKRPDIVVKKPKLGIRAARLIYTDQHESKKDPNVE